MSARTNRLTAQLGRFAQQYRRKSQRSTEPNDRQYSRETEAEMKRLPPVVLSELLSGDAEELVPAKQPKRRPEDPLAQYRKRKL